MPYACFEPGIRRAKVWMEACLDGHITCNQHTDARWLPTRLVDVSGVDADGGGRIKVVDTASEESISRYMSLSHAWGSEPFLTLSTSTKAELYAGVPTNRLSQTFRDAVWVNKALGVDYIWIDSLCIVQQDDGNRDWLIESGRMAQVYTNAYCNISATYSTQASEGLFGTRRTASTEGPILEIHGQHSLELRQSPLNHLGYWEKEVHHAPLHARAWVLQERLLSRRVLHFGRHEAFWECGQLEASETYHQGIGLHRSPQFKMLGSNDNTAPDNDTPTSAKARLNLRRKWDTVRCLYSSAKLTLVDDKMIAIAGIAESFERWLNDQYVVGHWRSTLLGELLWRASSRHSPVRDIPRYPAPTWSWLSADDLAPTPTAALHELTRSAQYSTRHNAEVLEIRLKHLANIHTGIATHASIVLRGLLAPVRISPEDDDGSYSLTFVPGGEVTSACLDHRWSQDTLGRNFYAALLSDRKGREDCLLLDAEDCEKGEFRRIGVAFYKRGLDQSPVEEHPAVMYRFRGKSYLAHERMPNIAYRFGDRIDTAPKTPIPSMRFDSVLGAHTFALI